MRYAQWVLVAIGIFSRLAQYIYNRPFWGDEIALLDNLIHRSYLALLQPLDHAQAAPIGFLWLEKLFISLFGSDTYGARLLPLVTALLALLLFYKLVTFLSPRISIIAIGFFATSNWLIYYASETKQYSLDVAITITLLLLVVMKPRLRWVILAGIIAVWFSHPAIFVLAAMGIVYWMRGETRKNLLFIGTSWLTSFCIVYVSFYSQTAANSDLLHYWTVREAGFIEIHPISMIRAIIETTTIVSGLFQPLLFAIALIGLIIGAWLLSQEKRILFLLPVMVVAVAAMLYKYPYAGRFILFTIPGLTYVTATGLTDLLEKFSPRNSKVQVILTSGLLALLLLQMKVTQNGLFR